jgi:hypothetical protein
MRVLNREDFLAMPAATIFAKGKPWNFGELCQKGDTLEGVDFIYLDLCTVESHDSGDWSMRLDDMLEKGRSYPFDDEGFGRDGRFDEDDLFLVFEKPDLLKLRNLIDGAIAIL